MTVPRRAHDDLVAPPPSPATKLYGPPALTVRVLLDGAGDFPPAALLAGIAGAAAVRRLAPGTHSIAEIVAHLNAVSAARFDAVARGAALPGREARRASGPRRHDGRPGPCRTAFTG